jgi:uncharacterized protein (TIGR01244 family)
MSDFRRVTDSFWASPQIAVEDVAEARARGAVLVINNRPDGEAADEPQGAEIEQAARAAGLDYRAIPVSHAGFSEAQVAATIEALEQAGGPVLAYCRSGTRSTLLWALAQARLGRDLDTVAAEAAGAGYDLASVRPLMEHLAAERSA